jgi:hypothetical protein
MTSVEEIIAQVDRTAPGAGTLELWIPDTLQLRGKPVRHDIAMAIILDRLYAFNLAPDGFVQGDGGRTYHYKHD